MPTLRIHVFQHVPFEGLGCIENWIRARGHALTATHFHAGQLPPDVGEVDWLIVMGGPMGVHDEVKFPWLREEKRALAAALSQGKTILGICLGAQLLAHVLGARVQRNREKEIGWFPVELNEDAGRAWPGTVFPASFTAFHWHGDTFDLPPGASPLGWSEACANQGFWRGEKVIGLQFHPEITPEIVRDWAGNLHAETQGLPHPFVQDEATILRGMPHIEGLNGMMEKLCEALEVRCLKDALNED